MRGIPGTTLVCTSFDAEASSARTSEILHDSLERRSGRGDFEVDAVSAQRAQPRIEVTSQATYATDSFHAQRLREAAYGGHDHYRSADLTCRRPLIAAAFDHDRRLKEITTESRGLIAATAYLQQGATPRGRGHLIFHALQARSRAQGSEVSGRAARITAFQKGNVLVQPIRQIVRNPLLGIDAGALSRALPTVEKSLRRTSLQRTVQLGVTTYEHCI